MTRLGDVSERQLARRLRTAGILLNSGAFRTKLRIEFREVVSEFVNLYANYPVEESPGISDFHLSIGAPNLLRRHVRPCVQACIDDEAPFQALPRFMAYPMLESALNWAIVQRVGRYVLLHAAVVEQAGRAIIIPAPSGSGKSTLCAALVCRGWRLLSDEIAIIRPTDGRALANPRPVALKNSSIQAVSRFSPDAYIGPACEGTIKGTVAFMRVPDDSIDRNHEDAVPALLISPAYRAGEPTRIDMMEKAQGFAWLVDNAINYAMTLERGFETFSTLVESCPIYRLRYSDLNDATTAIGRLHSTTDCDRQRAAG